MIKLLADVNVERSIVSEIRNSGYDIVWAAEGFGHLSDIEIIERANREERIILTNDKDFGEITFRQKLAQNGIILLRIKGVAEDEKRLLIISVLNNHVQIIPEHFVVITKEKIRIIPL